MVEVRRVPDEQCYLLEEDGAVRGRLQYANRGGVVVAMHTEVDLAYGGRGYGALLAKALLDDAVRAGATVQPVCWFVAGYIERHPEYARIVAGSAGS